jgi:hypothetical protein
MVPESMCFHSSSPRAVVDVTTELATEKRKGKSSRFSPFIETLPLDVSSIPALWTEEKLVEISGSQVEKDARAMRSEWLRDATEEVTSHPDAGFTVEDWLWARATVQCRAISFQKANPEKDSAKNADPLTVVAFLPYITIANHHDVLGCATGMGNGVTQPDSSFVFFSESKHYPGQQIYNSYGSISFQQKALSFGWIDRSTEVGSFCITVLDLPDDQQSIASKGIGSSSSRTSKQIELKTNIIGSQEGRSSSTWTARQRAAVEEASSLTKREIRRALRSFQESGQMSKLEAHTSLQEALRDRRAGLVRGLLSSGAISDSPSAAAIPVQPQSSGSGRCDSDEPSLSAESDSDCIRRVEMDAVESLLRQLETES